VGGVRGVLVRHRPPAGLFGYELHRSDCSVSRRPAQVLSVSALGAAAAITASVLNLTTG